MYSYICSKLAKLSLQIAAAGLCVIIVCVLYQVFGRYVMNDTPTWAEQLALLLVAYVTMLGTAVGVRDAGHIGLESFLVLAPDWLRTKMELLIHLFMITFGSAMSYYGITLAMGQWDELLPTLFISDGFRYLPIAICGILMTMFSIEHILAGINNEEVIPAWH